jgi:uncharacterized MAPEG superfamily protein
MNAELIVLALAGLLQIAQMIAFAIAGNMEFGIKKTLGPRDEKLEPTGTCARLQRAMNNHFEGLILFTIAVVVVTLGDQYTPITQLCAWIYLAARVLYIPAYVFGFTPWRSIIWSIGLLATTGMLIAALI